MLASASSLALECGHLTTQLYITRLHQEGGMAMASPTDPKEQVKRQQGQQEEAGTRREVMVSNKREGYGMLG